MAATPNQRAFLRIAQGFYEALDVRGLDPELRAEFERSLLIAARQAGPAKSMDDRNASGGAAAPRRRPRGDCGGA